MDGLAITPDYSPGALARLVEMHARYYAREWGFGAFFEARVAGDAAAFLRDLPRSDSRLWFARRAERIVGSIAIDGRNASEASAHLRWFVVDDEVRGMGLGAALLDEALAFCRRRNFTGVYLWTFAGLDAARRLYESRGFRLAEQIDAESWGAPAREQRFVLTSP